ncbi:MAG: hypothetical protein ABI867_42540 [Kofleriaceae bacterium]
MTGVLIVAPVAAYADGEDEPVVSGSANVSVSVPGGGAPMTPGEHVVVPAKRLFAHANLEFGMAKVVVGTEESTELAIGLAPDIYYGVNAKLTLGLIHSSQAKTGFMGGFGSSLCLTGDLCGDVYNGAGLDARYQLTEGNLGLAGNVAVIANALDPFTVALKLGVIGRYRPSPASPLAIEFAPSIAFGVTERDGDAMAGVDANKEVLSVPVTLLYSLSAKLAGILQTGVILPFSDAGDLYAVPLSLGVNFQVNKQLSVDAAFTLPFLLGGDLTPNGFDTRTITVGGGYAF